MPSPHRHRPPPSETSTVASVVHRKIPSSYSPPQAPPVVVVPPPQVNPFLRKQIGAAYDASSTAACDHCKKDVNIAAHKYCPHCGMRVQFQEKEEIAISRSAPLLSRLAVLKRNMGDVHVAMNDPADELEHVPEELKDTIIQQQQQAISELKKYVEMQALLSAEQAVQLDQLQAAVADDLSSVSDTTLMLAPDSSPSCSSGSDSWGFATRKQPIGTEEQQAEIKELQTCVEALTKGTYVEHLQKKTSALKLEVVKLKKWAKLKRTNERKKTENLRGWVDNQARYGVKRILDWEEEVRRGEERRARQREEERQRERRHRARRERERSESYSSDEQMDSGRHQNESYTQTSSQFTHYAEQVESDYDVEVTDEHLNTAFRPPHARRVSITPSTDLETPTSRPAQRILDQRRSAQNRPRTPTFNKTFSKLFDPGVAIASESGSTSFGIPKSESSSELGTQKKSSTQSAEETASEKRRRIIETGIWGGGGEGGGPGMAAFYPHTIPSRGAKVVKAPEGMPTPVPPAPPAQIMHVIVHDSPRRSPKRSPRQHSMSGSTARVRWAEGHPKQRESPIAVRSRGFKSLSSPFPPPNEPKSSRHISPPRGAKYSDY